MAEQATGGAGVDVAKLREMYALQRGEWSAHQGYVLCGDGWIVRGGSHVDTTYIAAAHNAMPALLAAAEERDRLREALDKYGVHLPECAYGASCTCGLDAALNGGAANG